MWLFSLKQCQKNCQLSDSKKWHINCWNVTLKLVLLCRINAPGEKIRSIYLILFNSCGHQAWVNSMILSRCYYKSSPKTSFSFASCSLVEKIFLGVSKSFDIKNRKKRTKIEKSLKSGSTTHCLTKLHQEDNLKSVSTYKDLFALLNINLRILSQICTGNFSFLQIRLTSS